MNPSTLHLSTQDYQIVSRLLNATGGKGPAIDRLRAELARAVVLDAMAMPAHTVGLNSVVRFEDLGDGLVEEYQVTLPAAADADRRRISVFSPVGAALLGYAAGEEIEWPTPGGIRRLRILGVTRDVPLAAAV